jgi:hypothetical protein
VFKIFSRRSWKGTEAWKTWCLLEEDKVWNLIRNANMSMANYRALLDNHLAWDPLLIEKEAFPFVYFVRMFCNICLKHGCSATYV